MKKDNTKEVIKAKVNQAWDDLQYYSARLGANNGLTKRFRTEWAILDDLWRELYPDEKY